MNAINQSINQWITQSTNQSIVFHAYLGCVHERTRNVIPTPQVLEQVSHLCHPDHPPSTDTVRFSMHEPYMHHCQSNQHSPTSCCLLKDWFLWNLTDWVYSFNVVVKRFLITCVIVLLLCERPTINFYDSQKMSLSPRETKLLLVQTICFWTAKRR